MSDADKLAYLDKVPSKRRPPRRVVLAIVGAVVVVAVLAVLSAFRNPVVGSASVLGLCLEVKAENVARDDQGRALARVLVATPDSTDVELLLPPPLPRPGDFLPLVVDEYKRGNKDYAVDAAKWAAEGPL
ncbi:hypothetical protein FJ250_06955 [bacterium]|nr:hypothetical protein [bacterium]